jgi:hypothetical protein
VQDDDATRAMAGTSTMGTTTSRQRPAMSAITILIIAPRRSWSPRGVPTPEGRPHQEAEIEEANVDHKPR